MNDEQEYETAFAYPGDFPLRAGDKISFIEGVARVTKFVEGSKKYGIVKKIRYITETGERMEVDEWTPEIPLKSDTQVRVIHNTVVIK